MQENILYAKEFQFPIFQGSNTAFEGPFPAQIDTNRDTNSSHALMNH